MKIQSPQESNSRLCLHTALLNSWLNSQPLFGLICHVPHFLSHREIWEKHFRSRHNHTGQRLLIQYGGRRKLFGGIRHGFDLQRRVVNSEAFKKVKCIFVKHRLILVWLRLHLRWYWCFFVVSLSLNIHVCMHVVKGYFSKLITFGWNLYWLAKDLFFRISYRCSVELWKLIQFYDFHN